MNQLIYSIRWRQEYHTWPEPELDLAQARAVLARIMSL